MLSVIPDWLLVASLIIVAMALAMTLINVTCFRRSNPDATVGDDPPRIDVCIPARNEAANIEACVRLALASDYPNLRVLVYDDQSTDGTGQIVARLAAEDSRVVAVESRELPEGWVGKQWACWQLGQRSMRDGRDTDWMLFIDADVRLSADCLRRALASAGALGAPLLSTFPRQITGTPGEKLIVPLIHFILLSYLPFLRMRRSNDPAASAACGQFILTRADAYACVGGHSACRDSMHEGVKLPRLYRRAGFHTDLFDGTDVCVCRMYRGWMQTWRGFAKNAYEGLGSIGLLVFCTVLHMIGHVLPALWLAIRGIAAVTDPRTNGWAWGVHERWATLAVITALAHRTLLAVRFRQGALTVLAHPVSMLLLTALQWHSFVLSKVGLRAWKGRTLAKAQTMNNSSAMSTLPGDARPPHA